MSKIKAKNTLYNDPRYDVVVDSRMLEQHLKEKDQQIAELKQQLEEKDQAIEGLQEINQSLGQTCNNDAKEIERLREQLTEEKTRNKKLNHEAQKYYEDAYCNNFQNQKAIRELEKVKEYNKTLVYSSSLIDKYIDQQIKLLKGDM